MSKPLQKKYRIEDVGTKMFVVGRFLEYKMVDSKIVISQVREFQLILYKIKAEGRILPETFQVTTIIEKSSHLCGEISRTTCIISARS